MEGGSDRQGGGEECFEESVGFIESIVFYTNHKRIHGFCLSLFLAIACS